MAKRKQPFNNRIGPKKKKDESIDDSAYKVEINVKDSTDRKVDVIVKDVQNKSYRSLTIWGTGMSIEKTIGVAEELKRFYEGRGTKYLDETTIRTGENNQPRLEVVLKPLTN